MSNTNQTLKLKETKILYNAEGEPEFVLFPYAQVRNLVSLSVSKKIYPLDEREIVAAVDEVREELFRKYYGDKIKNPA